MHAPKGVVQQELWMANFHEIKMQKGEDPHLNFNRIDEAVAILTSLEIVETDPEIRRRTVRHHAGL